MNNNFHWKIKTKYAELKDGICCQEITDRTGFHFLDAERKQRSILIMLDCAVFMQEL